MWTFDAAKRTKVATSYALFVVVCIAGLFVRLGVMHLLIEFYNMGLGYRYVLASIIGIFVATMFNFLGTKFIAFSRKLNDEQERILHNKILINYVNHCLLTFSQFVIT